MFFSIRYASVSWLTYLARRPPVSVVERFVRKGLVASQSIMSLSVVSLSLCYLSPRYTRRFYGSLNASILDPIVWRSEVYKPYSVGTRKTLTNLSCILRFTAFLRREILILSSKDKALAFASSVSNRGRNRVNGSSSLYLIKYRLIKAFFY
jgi:hypothetical protein